MLKQRVWTALVLVLGLVLLLGFGDSTAWSVFLLVVSGLAADEWGRLARPAPLPRYVYPAITVLVLTALLFWPALVSLQSPLLFLAVAFWLAAVPLWLRRGWHLAGAGACALIGWVVILPCAIALHVLHGFGNTVLLAAMGLVWVSDITAYFAGRRFGRHRLAPAISPGKTWEGVAGALGGVLLFGLVLRLPVAESTGIALLQHPAGALWLPALLLLAALGIEGDLLESWLKRCAGVKDSGWVLPGHGGVLDRIDALTAALPAAAWLALQVAHVGAA